MSSVELETIVDGATWVESRLIGRRESESSSVPPSPNIRRMRAHTGATSASQRNNRFVACFSFPESSSGEDTAARRGRTGRSLDEVLLPQRTQWLIGSLGRRDNPVETSTVCLMIILNAQDEVADFSRA